MFGLLDDIDRQDVKNWLNSAVDNTADLYDTITEYDYSNMFDDIGDYFRGLLADDEDPRSKLTPVSGSSYRRGGFRGNTPPSVTVERVTTNRPKLMGVLESINEEYKPLSGPSTQPMMMPQRIKDAEMRRRGAEDIRLQYPEFDMMMQMNRPRRATVAPAEEAVVNPGGYKTLAERDDAYPLPEYLKRRVREQVRNDNRLSTAQAAADAQIGNALRQRYMPSINPAPNPFPLL